MVNHHEADGIDVAMSAGRFGATVPPVDDIYLVRAIVVKCVDWRIGGDTSDVTRSSRLRREIGKQRPMALFGGARGSAVQYQFSRTGRANP